ncbi:MAG: hypothetical protein HKN07_07185 [Acidimicrobiia bacterium]|nr:hypothetical protein [Acidimicrobiia bacterium]NNF64029.1 hypothetical protein [Acidimicrobiia bacterium]
MARTVSPDQGPFDLEHLSRSIERARADKNVTWGFISEEVGVSTSTIRRLATAADAEADGVLALVRWLGDPPERFITASKVPGEPLLPAGSGMIRVDMSLVARLAGSGSRGRVGSRTTIQRLARVAQASGRTIASLTRHSLK